MREVNREISNNSQEASALKEEGDSIKASLAGMFAIEVYSTPLLVESYR